MELFKSLTSNYIFNLCALSWFTAQFTKFLINLIVAKRVRLERLYGSGGMPSAHTALVSSLVMGVAKVCGLDSAEFVISAVMAAIVIYDSMGVRRAAGEHAKVLNRMMYEDDYNSDNSDETPSQKELKELLGHTPMEVLGGAMLGILLSMIYRY